MAKLYKLSDKCAVAWMEIQDEKTGLLKKEIMPVVFPFGKIAPISDETLTDEIAEWLLTRPDFQEGGEFYGHIVKKQADKITKSKNN